MKSTHGAFEEKRCSCLRNPVRLEWKIQRREIVTDDSAVILRAKQKHMSG
jgi:hypothetical protein